jgi:hypothetical protein
MLLLLREIGPTVTNILAHIVRPQVKAKAVAELTRLKQTGGFRWVTNYRNPLAKIPALAYEALIEGCCGAGLVRVCVNPKPFCSLFLHRMFPESSRFQTFLIFFFSFTWKGV